MGLAHLRPRTVDLDGPVHVVEFGGDGPPILLVHGIGGSHVNFLSVADGFARLGRTYGVDLIGYGYTPPAGRDSDLRTNRRMLVRLLREVIGEPTLLVGTSLGGLLSLLVAGAAPDDVDGLVLVGPGQPYPRGVPVNWPSALSFLALATPGLGRVLARWQWGHHPDTLAEQGLRRVCHDPTRVSDEMRAAYTRVLHDRSTMPWTAETFRQTARSLVRELPRTRGYEAFVQRLRPPVLIVHGEEDRLVAPEASVRLAAMRPDWRLEMLPDVGHSPQIEVPDRLLAVVGDWLAEGVRGRHREHATV